MSETLLRILGLNSERGAREKELPSMKIRVGRARIFAWAIVGRPESSR